MSNQNIFVASSRGDLDRVKYLVEVEKVNVNIKDNVIKEIFCFYLLMFLF